MNTRVYVEEGRGVFFQKMHMWDRWEAAWSWSKPAAGPDELVQATITEGSDPPDLPISSDCSMSDEPELLYDIDI